LCRFREKEVPLTGHQHSIRAGGCGPWLTIDQGGGERGTSTRCIERKQSHQLRPRTKEEKMIYELRIYEAIPGKLPALNERFAKITMGYFKKYGLKMVGFWTDEVGITNRLTYMLAFDDMAQRDKAWAGFRTDPERVKAFAETEKDGPLVARVTNTIMRPTAYSPLQ